MSAPVYAALFFTVVLLVTMAYFLMGGLPLLILQHDTPVDGRFVHRFFDIYYKAAIFASAGACISYALWGRPMLSVGTAAIGVIASALRRSILPAMEKLGGGIAANDNRAIKAFRKIHLLALTINLILLVVLVWGVTKISL